MIVRQEVKTNYIFTLIKPGIEVDDVRYDTSHLVEDYNEDFFASDGINKLKETFDPAKATIIEPNKMQIDQG